MTDPELSFVPEPPDPRLEELDEQAAAIMAEALVRFILRKGLLKKPPGSVPNSVDSKSRQMVCVEQSDAPRQAAHSRGSGGVSPP